MDACKKGLYSGGQQQNWYRYKLLAAENKGQTIQGKLWASGIVL